MHSWDGDILHFFRWSSWTLNRRKSFSIVRLTTCTLNPMRSKKDKLSILLFLTSLPSSILFLSYQSGIGIFWKCKDIRLLNMVPESSIFNAINKSYKKSYFSCRLESVDPSIRIANSPTFVAFWIATVATGTPLGICKNASLVITTPHLALPKTISICYFALTLLKLNDELFFNLS